AHGTHEQQKAQRGERVKVVAEEMDGFAHSIWRMGEYHRKFNRAIGHEYAEDAERETKVTHPVDHEGFYGSGIGAFAGVPETDQQIGRKAHTFPTKEHLDEVVGGDERQHGKGE